jgi:hypothetical protein
VNISLTEIDSERQLFVRWRQANPHWGFGLEKAAGRRRHRRIMIPRFRNVG